MVLVSHIYKFIYIKNRKVAGTSVEVFFEKYCLDPKKEYKVHHERDECVSEFGIVGGREGGKCERFENHMPCHVISDVLGKKMFKKYFKFCVVRNPYDKMVSAFHHLVKGTNEENYKEEFKKFCANKGSTTNCIYNCIKKNRSPICNYFIRYENLIEDIKRVCEILRIKEYDLSSLPNFKSEYRKEKRHYREYYDEETRKIVYEKHKAEFDYFKYEF
jgi:hypothetical protein